MAPSTLATRTVPSKAQPTLAAFSKVTKSTKATEEKRLKSKTAVTIDQCLKELEQPVVQATPTNKRKRCYDSEDEDSKKGAIFETTQKKKKVLLLSPPSSRRRHAEYNADTTPSSPCSRLQRVTLSSPVARKASQAEPERPRTADLPESLKELVSIHESFLRAFSLHFAYNGAAAPADLKSVLDATTALWKKRRLFKVDIQRMLAIYEVAAQSGDDLTHALPRDASAFKLTTSGIGMTSRTCVEYVGRAERDSLTTIHPKPFDEQCLQVLYKGDAHAVFLKEKSKASSFVHGPLSGFPLLACEVGLQTIARKQKAASTRDEILSLSAHAQPSARPKTTPQSSSEDMDPFASSTIKSRTASLFDRVRQKQVANSSAPSPTPEALLRRHATGRITEVVGIIRMRQQQKLGIGFSSALEVGSSKIRGRVSFSMQQIIAEIKQSVNVPLSDQEVKMCIQLLTEEVPSWLSMHRIGSIETVVLNGNGLSGEEVKSMLAKKEMNLVK